MNVEDKLYKLDVQIENLNNTELLTSLIIFGFERRVSFLNGNTWTYDAGFVYERENNEKVHGQFLFAYNENVNPTVLMRFYDEITDFKEEEINDIQQSLSTYPRYVVMIEKHKQFIDDLNLLIIEKKEASWDKLKKELLTNGEFRLRTKLTMDTVLFDIIIHAHKEDNEMVFDSIQISQEDETFNKAFEVNQILKEYRPDVYRSWDWEMNMV